MTRWSIRTKLLVGLALLAVIVGTLSWGGIHGLYAYRSLVRGLNRRVTELPLAAVLSRRVSDLRVAAAQWAMSPPGATDDPSPRTLKKSLAACRKALVEYQQKLADNPDRDGINDGSREQIAADSLSATLDRVERTALRLFERFDGDAARRLDVDLERLADQAETLPGHLHQSILDHTDDDSAKSQYRKLIALTWITSATSVAMCALLVRLFYQWLFRPLKVLIAGSRKVAAGAFEHQIRLETHDEMAELAAAMNDTTARFRAIRDDLDRQVRERTKQVVRSEQLASVGFLAAGVAHEINNPLASIAMCAESLESRLTEDPTDRSLFAKYLRTIQDEAFRCKEITEKLLDFSRPGEVKRQPAELRGLIEGVIDVLGRLGKYRGKRLELAPGPALSAPVNHQEIKQVVLNLLANALDSIEADGRVEVALAARDGFAELTVTDDGCGMTPEVLEHLFEPFFTRRRGGQGTGLGLSIAYRIIADHAGALEAASAGPNRGSQFCVRLPLTLPNKESNHRQAA